MTPSAAVRAERLIARERRHWITLVHPLSLASLPVLAAVVATAALHPSLELAVLMLLAVLSISGGVTVGALAAWTCTDVLLTDRRVMVRTGVLARSTQAIALDRIQDVSTATTTLGRLLNFGRLEIDAAGATGRQVVAGLRAPELMRDRVFRQSQTLKRDEERERDVHRRRAAETAGAGGVQAGGQDRGRAPGRRAVGRAVRRA